MATLSIKLYLFIVSTLYDKVTQKENLLGTMNAGTLTLPNFKPNRGTLHQFRRLSRWPETFKHLWMISFDLTVHYAVIQTHLASTLWILPSFIRVESPRRFARLEHLIGTFWWTCQDMTSINDPNMRRAVIELRMAPPWIPQSRTTWRNCTGQKHLRHNSMTFLN